jgi:hypothetical protein
MIREYDFQERLAFSSGVSASGSIEAILLMNIPGATKAYKAGGENDRDGTDWWVEIPGRHLSIDCKVRTDDCLPKYGADDLALETFSVVETGKFGWTRDPNKRTDYVLWLWMDTRRWCLISFPQLCAVFTENWQGWKTQHKVATQKTPNSRGGYHSECVFVPRHAVWAAMYRRFGGNMPHRETPA